MADRTVAAGSDNLTANGYDAEPVMLGKSPAKRDWGEPVRVAKDNRMHPMDGEATKKIARRLDPGDVGVAARGEARQLAVSTLYVGRG